MTDEHGPDARGLPMVTPPDPVLLAEERAWLGEVQKRGFGGRALAYLGRGGPGYLQAALTLGGGSASASLLAGAAFGYDLMWVAPLGMLIGIVMLAAVAHQTLSTGVRPFEAMRLHAGAAAVADVILSFSSIALRRFQSFCSR